MKKSDFSFFFHKNAFSLKRDEQRNEIEKSFWEDNTHDFHGEMYHLSL